MALLADCDKTASRTATIFFLKKKMNKIRFVNFLIFFREKEIYKKLLALVEK